MMNTSYNTPAFRGNIIVKKGDAKKAADFFKSVRCPTEGPFPLVPKKTGWAYFKAPDQEDWVNDVGLNRHKIFHIIVNDERLKKLKSGITDIVKKMKSSEKL